jgi:hypothetical protein
MADEMKELRARNIYVRERLKELKSEQERLKGELATLREKLSSAAGGRTQGHTAGKGA